MKYLHFDLRALSLMRIGIALVIIFDLCVRLTDLEVFYADTGVVPLHLLFSEAWNSYFISFHTISGLWEVQLAIFLLAIFCALMLLIGYRTRLFSVLSWLLMLSLHNRNPFILQGGDDLLRMILFWGMFLPWGVHYSYDSLRSARKTSFGPVLSLATIAYLLQICYLYTGSALLKGPEWHTEFTAVYYAYSLEQIAYPTAKLFYENPDALRLLTQIAYYFELWVPVLFFIPFKHGFFRALAVGLIILFHFNNLLTLFIGFFPLIGMVTVLGLLPSGTMNSFEKYSQRLRKFLKPSLLQAGAFLNRRIRWKKPRLALHPVHDYTQTAILIFLIVYVFDWNFSNLVFVRSKLSDNLRFIGYTLRLDQSWGMFAPGVFKDDGWYILEGVTKDSTTLNLLSPDDSLHYQKPESVVSMFKNDRWRKYSENYLFPENESIRGYFCNYYKRIWNENNEDRPVQRLRVIYMHELTLPDYTYSPPEKQILWECY